MTFSNSEIYYKYVHFPVSDGIILDKPFSSFPWIPKVTYVAPTSVLAPKIHSPQSCQRLISCHLPSENPSIISQNI